MSGVNKLLGVLTTGGGGVPGQVEVVEGVKISPEAARNGHKWCQKQWVLTLLELKITKMLFFT
jgi:hypothetical protein